MADYVQKLKKDTREFTHAINHCLNNLKQKNFYLTNIDNENISERSKEVGEKVYDYMLSILEKMFNNDENKFINNDDYNKTSKSYFKIKQEIIKNINSDINLNQKDGNMCRENNNTLKNNNSLIVMKHVSADKTKVEKLEDTSSLSNNNSLKQNLRRTRCSNSIKPERSFYNDVNSDDDEEEEEEKSDDDDDDYDENRINNKNGRPIKKRKKYMILPYSEKVKLVDLSIDNPAWSWDQLKQVTGCHSYVRSRAHFLDIKRQILNDRNTYEKFKTINDWIYQSCVIENPDIMEITDAKLKSYTKRAKKVFSPEANEFSMTKGWVYYMKKRLGITDESNDFKPNVKQEPEKSGSKNVGIYLFKHSSSFEEDEAHDEDSDWSFNDNTEVLEDEEYHYVASGDDDDDDNDEATLSSKSCVDSKLSYENDNVDCKNIKKELKTSSTNKYHDSDTNKDNKTILKEIIEPSAKKLKTNVSDEEKKRVVDMARKNPQWNLEQLKKESKCQELLFVSQLYDWQSQLEQNRPGSSKSIF